MPPKFQTAETRKRLAEMSRGNTNRRKFHKAVDGAELKHCCRCDQWKPLDQYFKHSTCWDGLTTWCKVCTSADCRRYVIADRMRARRIQRQWWEKNQDRHNANARKKYQRYSESPKFRICAAIRAGIVASLKGTKNGRRWRELVGYSLKNLVSHLQRLLQPGMTFENYGDWHIDHRRPIASFSFASPEDPGFKECWALDNLQPLWATENMSKGARYEN